MGKIKNRTLTRILVIIILTAFSFITIVSVPIVTGSENASVYAVSKNDKVKAYRESIKTYFEKTAKLASTYHARDKYAATAKSYYKKSLKTTKLTALKSYEAKTKAAYYDAKAIIAPLSVATLKKYRESILTDTNALRAKLGIKPLILDAKLADAAQIRAKEISVSFSHDRPDGRSCFTAFPSGYGYAFGENIAMGYSIKDIVNVGWANSPGHYANMTNGSYNLIGIGVFRNEKGGLFYTQVFAGGKG